MGLKMHTLRMALAVFLTTSALLSFAQKPVITNINRTSAANQQVVTLEGQGFATPADLEVYFGAAKATIVPGQNSDQFLDVKAPAGATYDKIAVRHKPSGLTEYSPQNFFLSFGGPHGVSSTRFNTQKDFDSQSGLGLYDLCMCDFDGDGRTDVATANDAQFTTAITLHANTSTAPGLATMSFAGTSINISAPTIHVTCGDLNGDGKPEIVLSEGGAAGDDIFILRNTSTGPGNFSFSAPQTIKITGARVKRVKIGDLDKDGKPEVIVSNQGSPNIAVLNNQTPTAATTFTFTQTQVPISGGGASIMDDISINDLDGDGLPEVILSQFFRDNIFILRNISTPGNISLVSSPPIVLPISLSPSCIKVGDLDGDGRSDIAVAQLDVSGSSISLFRNTSSLGNISFSSPVPFVTAVRPWGIDFGDLDGDGKPDIVVASIAPQPGTGDKVITVLNNQSTPGSFSFQISRLTTTYVQRHLFIGDVDGDAKPDIVFTSIDDNSSGIPASKISVIRNAHCVQPVIDPATPQTVCVGVPVQLTTHVNPGTSYEWKNGAATLTTGPNPFYDVNVSAAATFNITVKATSEGGSCALTSTPPVAVDVIVPSRSLNGTPALSSNGPVCVGSTLSLEVDNAVNADIYLWKGPAGYTGNSPNPAPVPNFQEINAGRYHLDLLIDGCIAGRASIVVEVIPVPDFQVNIGGASVACPPATKTLTVTPSLPNFTYTWFERTAGALGVMATTYNATASGKYYVKAQYTPNPGCSSVETDDVEITFATPPAAGFSHPPKACKDEDITFTNTTIADGSVTTEYTWSFDDGNTSGLSSPVKKYSAAGTYTVTLTASYAGGACTDIHTSTIVIEQATPSSITTDGNTFSFCSGDALELEVTGSFTAYDWSTGETTSSITVTEAGTYSVTTQSPNGCTFTTSREVSVTPAPEVIVSTEASEIREGQSATLTASGLSSYAWETGGTPLGTGESIVVSPLTNTVYHVSGTDNNGCPGHATFELSVREGSIYEKIKPSPFFSPDNGDDFGKYWSVEKITDYPQCEIAVFDIKGIRVYQTTGYNNDWDGTFKGTKLPDGVYYFIIKCPGEENPPKTGSITLLR